MGLEEEDHRDKALCTPPHIQSVYYLHDVSLLTLATWLRSCLSGFLHGKVVPVFLLSLVCFLGGKKVLCSNP